MDRQPSLIHPFLTRSHQRLFHVIDILIGRTFIHVTLEVVKLSSNMIFPTMWYVRPAKAQTSLRIRAVWSEPLIVAWIFYDSKATDRTSFGVSKLKRRPHRLVWVYTFQMLHCWKWHVAAQLLIGRCRPYFLHYNKKRQRNHMAIVFKQAFKRANKAIQITVRQRFP